MKLEHTDQVHVVVLQSRYDPDPHVCLLDGALVAVELATEAQRRHLLYCNGEQVETKK